ncbi:MAG: hypothetical protein K8L97_14885 [Anaerolineae bacterium]|nr:hypothetical protein [Anaerolineae bacterium]
MVEGSITVKIGGEVFETGSRSFVFLPRGIPHSWDVTSCTATVLMITTPAGLEEFLGEYHTATSKEDKDRIAAQHGITWVND